MRTQVLKAQRFEIIVIPTPMGLISLTRLKNRQWRLEMPDECRAFKTVERAIQESPFLEHDNGVIRPAYRILVPVLDKQGAVTGVEVPRGPLRIQPKRPGEAPGSPKE